jgi:hypothetical protein
MANQADRRRSSRTSESFGEENALFGPESALGRMARTESLKSKLTDFVHAIAAASDGHGFDDDDGDDDNDGFGRASEDDDNSEDESNAFHMADDMAAFIESGVAGRWPELTSAVRAVVAWHTLHAEKQAR